MKSEERRAPFGFGSLLIEKWGEVHKSGRQLHDYRTMEEVRKGVGWGTLAGCSSEEATGNTNYEAGVKKKKPPIVLSRKKYCKDPWMLSRMGNVETPA